MTSTIKFGTLLGLFLFAFGLVVKYIGIGPSSIIPLIIFILLAFMVYAAIRAFLQQDKPRPIYNYGKGALLGLGVVLIGIILYALLETGWSLMDENQVVTASDFFSHIWHGGLLSGIIVALLVPLLFFGKNEKTASLKDELLDAEM
jgi:cellobiose-specific phosphotransferase system component IIC